jgi:hypothetical protein
MKKPRETEETLASSRLYLASMSLGSDGRALFGDLKTYCVFLGYPRSGHSLIGALLDAHPEVIIAQELDVLRYVAAGFSQQEIYHLLLENSRAAKAGGRMWGEYSYDVPNQWQGRFRTLRVIGDKKGGGSLRRLHAEPELLGRLRRTIDLDIKFVHVVRNPYDNISTMARHREARDLSLASCIDSYFARCQTFAAVRRQIADTDILELKYESFVADPTARLEELCRFLGVAADAEYLSDCAGIVYESLHKSRYKVPWTDEGVDVVRKRMSEFPFLGEYSYES